MAKITFQKEEFEVLQQRLLHQELNRTADWAVHAQIMEECRIAGEMALDSGFPILVFPALFEERVAATLRVVRIEEMRFWASLRSLVKNVNSM